MAYLGTTYTADPNNVAGDYTPVPPCDYVVQVDASEIKDAKKQGNRFIELSLLILEGPEAGRKLTDRINLWNDNPKAVEIAQRSLNAICAAVGKLAIGDTNELHGVPMIAVVKVDEAKPYTDPQTGEQKQGSPQNSIRTYKPLSAGVAAAPAAATGQPGSAAATGVSAPSSGGRLPWKQKAA